MRREIRRQPVIESLIDEHGDERVQPVAHGRQTNFPTVHGTSQVAAIEIPGVIHPAVNRIDRRTLPALVALSSCTHLPHPISSKITAHPPSHSPHTNTL